MLQLPADGSLVYFSRTLTEIEPSFKCSLPPNQGCLEGRKSRDGKAIDGVQYRKQECVWLGQPCPNLKIKTMEPFCSVTNDAHLQICGFEHQGNWISVPSAGKGRKHRIFRWIGQGKLVFVFLCDYSKWWTNWSEWTSGKPVDIFQFYVIRRRRFCFDPADQVVIEEEESRILSQQQLITKKNCI